jgi:hypothetical protein
MIRFHQQEQGTQANEQKKDVEFMEKVCDWFYEVCDSWWNVTDRGGELESMSARETMTVVQMPFRARAGGALPASSVRRDVVSRGLETYIQMRISHYRLSEQTSCSANKL